ncbi:MAG TPA: tetratricopeptide repeat protein [Candidatus Paceibacterota bacterium]|nr:tetratricopeptide repeat protein [Verrucomicrobiota bacterium]HRY50732.1 tetratricopeptide repeat protein [Candidatus Paceibacterota bacterium]HSA00590.1 tetratricopeptide repeat protein [Candidatus Paceibacterota bacterium]
MLILCTTTIWALSSSPQSAQARTVAEADDRVPQPQAEAAALKREAVAVAIRVSETYPQDALSFALLGAAYYNTGQSEKAIKHLQKCLELSPNQSDAYEVLARVAYEKGQLDEAVRLCQESIQRGPANPQVLNQLGRALMDQGKTAQAIEILQRAVRLPKPLSESSYLLGQACLQSENYLQAKESFQRAIALMPDHTQAFFGLYTACQRLGQTEEAARYREQFQKLEAIDRRSLTDRSGREDTLTGLPLVRKTVAQTLFGAAQIYSVHNESAKAAELFLKSARLDTDNPVYRLSLEAHYVKLKAFAEGLAVFNQLISEQPTSSLNHLFLGRFHGRLGQFEPAEQAFRKVQQLAPQWAEGYRALAELYLRSNLKPAEAQLLAQRAVEIEPTHSHYYLLAVACVKNKDRPGAREAIKRALALNPGENRYQEFLQQLGELP